MAITSLDELKHKDVDETYEENAIKSTPQDGKVITRRKFTKTRKKFSVDLVMLNNDEARDLRYFYFGNGTMLGVETTLSFSWVNPADNALYTVRFESPISMKKNSKFPDYYDVATIKLIEV